MILYGRPVAEAIEENLKVEVKKLKAENISPFLAVILVGSDPASILYTRKKQEKAESLGIGFRLHHLPEGVSEENILELIGLLNCNKTVHGIIVQLPLPDKFDSVKILQSIAPQKDIEKASPAASAILEIINYYKIDLKNKKIVLVGRGKLVGEPLEKIFNEMNLDVVVCDSKTLNLKPITLTADIIISGVGKPGLITSEMVKSDTVIIDAGTAESGGATAGDVAPEVYAKVQSYSPVPGGVGPVTVAELLKNLVEAAERSKS